MTLRHLSISLLFIYGAAILSFSVWEVGHSILHAFKNSGHHHTHGHHHKAQDHHAMIAVDHSNDDPGVVNSITCYFLFFEVCTLALEWPNILRQQFSQTEPKLLKAICPFFDPPPNL
mgnify:CR=1 FL=1